MARTATVTSCGPGGGNSSCRSVIFRSEPALGTTYACRVGMVFRGEARSEQREGRKLGVAQQYYEVRAQTPRFSLLASHFLIFPLLAFPLVKMQAMPDIDSSSGRDTAT